MQFCQLWGCRGSRGLHEAHMKLECLFTPHWGSDRVLLRLTHTAIPSGTRFSIIRQKYIFFAVAPQRFLSVLFTFCFRYLVETVFYVFRPTFLYVFFHVVLRTQTFFLLVKNLKNLFILYTQFTLVFFY